MIKASITAYSTAVGPSSALINRLIFESMGETPCCILRDPQEAPVNGLVLCDSREWLEATTPFDNRLPKLQANVCGLGPWLCVPVLQPVCLFEMLAKLTSDVTFLRPPSSIRSPGLDRHRQDKTNVKDMGLGKNAKLLANVSRRPRLSNLKNKKRDSQGVWESQVFLIRGARSLMLFAPGYTLLMAASASRHSRIASS